MKNLPFQIQKNSGFTAQMSDWIADQFYEVFPDHGLEIRDEQIYMAYQLEKAFEKNEIILAEAGVGTGKGQTEKPPPQGDRPLCQAGQVSHPPGSAAIPSPTSAIGAGRFSCWTVKSTAEPARTI